MDKDKLIQQLQEKDQIIQDLMEKVNDLTCRLEQAEKRIATLDAENAALKAENAVLKTENAKLKSENAELKARLNQNSKNSSKPPSSEGYQKKPALPRSKKGKKGGQKGHRGRTLEQVAHPDQVIPCGPGACTCGHSFTSQELKLAEQRQVFDLPQPRLEVSEYQIQKATCPYCGTTCRGTAPVGVNAPTQYGHGVKAYMVLLGTHFTVPFKKVQLLFGDLFGYPINESTAWSAGQLCYDKLAQAEEIIKTQIAASPIAHADETGMRVDGKLHWLHTATTPRYTYLFAHKKRGRLALESSKSLLPHFAGWLVHDCWSSYFKFHGFKHAICGAHILRELEGLIENHQSQWAKTLKAFLLHLYHMPFEERVRRRAQLCSRYERICTIGQQLEPAPVKTKGKRGRYKRTKGRNLVERLIKEKNAVLAFAFNPDVPFTNNLAERDIRPLKVKQKVSNCFRTVQGADIYARLQSFISTARKNNCNVFSELCHTFEGYNFISRD